MRSRLETTFLKLIEFLGFLRLSKKFQLHDVKYFKDKTENFAEINCEHKIYNSTILETKISKHKKIVCLN